MRKILLLLPFFLWTCGGGGGSTEPEPPQLPTVTNIEVTTLEDTAKTFALTGTDPNNLALTYSISTQPQHGTISISGGAATYSPNANYHGQDVIAFLASSTNGNSNIGTIIITVTPVDDEPNTMDVTATTDEDNSVTITLEAEEYDGENIEFLVRNNPSNGSVTISGTTATYTPNEDWFGTDTFNFEAVDSSSRSVLNNATATIVVNPINDKPIVESFDIEIFINSSKDIELSGSDVDGDNLSFEITNTPSSGSASINGNILSFDSPSSEIEDSISYRAFDGNEYSESAEINIEIVSHFKERFYENEFSQCNAQRIFIKEQEIFVFHTCGGNRNAYVAKLLQNGELIWNKSIGIDYIDDIIIDENGFFLVREPKIISLDFEGNVISEIDFFSNDIIQRIFKTSEGNFLIFSNGNGFEFEGVMKLDNNFNIISSFERNMDDGIGSNFIETDGHFYINSNRIEKDLSFISNALMEQSKQLIFDSNTEHIFSLIDGGKKLNKINPNSSDHDAETIVTGSRFQRISLFDNTLFLAWNGDTGGTRIYSISTNGSINFNINLSDLDVNPETESGIPADLIAIDENSILIAVNWGNSNVGGFYIQRINFN